MRRFEEATAVYRRVGVIRSLAPAAEIARVVVVDTAEGWRRRGPWRGRAGAWRGRRVCRGRSRRRRAGERRGWRLRRWWRAVGQRTARVATDAFATAEWARRGDGIVQAQAHCGDGLARLVLLTVRRGQGGNRRRRGVGAIGPAQGSTHRRLGGRCWVGLRGRHSRLRKGLEAASRRKLASVLLLGAEAHWIVDGRTAARWHPRRHVGGGVEALGYAPVAEFGAKAAAATARGIGLGGGGGSCDGRGREPLRW